VALVGFVGNPLRHGQRGKRVAIRDPKVLSDSQVAELLIGEDVEVFGGNESRRRSLSGVSETGIVLKTTAEGIRILDKLSDLDSIRVFCPSRGSRIPALPLMLDMV